MDCIFTNSNKNNKTEGANANKIQLKNKIQEIVRKTDADLKTLFGFHSEPETQEQGAKRGHGPRDLACVDEWVEGQTTGSAAAHGLLKRPLDLDPSSAGHRQLEQVQRDA
eukprot:CAMPEP_0116918638 /NCGR_PEP_ID=MMETSP0467-20121206/19885_1 /TAXON_ID=283647 /ORGANISM="Mesodinium pulex, Strain SPMC105" /LENGTH=109 /DNA_ID=CAMNT_0004596015 /DNA_START=950 /DNA_END=1278 /DNA_ORIENTATION=+